MATPVRLVHVLHNGFLVRLGEGGQARTLLFDYPADKHVPGDVRPRAEALVQEETRGADLVVLISHSHGDHCNPRLPELVAGARRTTWVLSDDVPDMVPEMVEGLDPAHVLVVEPDEEYEFEGLRVATLMSNDLGVAFLLRVAGLTVYFGGDLALWDWPSATGPEIAFTRSFFSRALDRVRESGPVDLAFSNVDPRLDSLAGGPEFVDRVRPGLFAPMHTFGRNEVLTDFRERVAGTGVEVFVYSRCGDAAEYLLDESRARLVSGSKGE